MPKPIKKRIVKKTSPEKDVTNVYEQIKEYYENNARTVQIILMILGIVLAGAVGGYYFSKRTTGRSAALRYEAYKSYAVAKSQNDTALFQESLEKIRTASAAMESPVLTYYEADVYQGLGDIDKAIDTLNDMQQKFSSDDYVVLLSYGKLGMLYLQKADYESALNVFKSLANSSMSVYRDFALYQQAKIYMKQGQDAEAKRLNERLVQLFPDSPYAQEVALELKAEEEQKEKEDTAEQSENKTE